MANCCDYCTPDSEGYVQKLPREGNINAAMLDFVCQGTVLLARGPYKSRAEFPINFCPMCGRDLRKK